GLMFLASLNTVLRRLGAMLPDEALRHETKQFTTLNLNLVLATFLLATIYLSLNQFPQLPAYLPELVVVVDHGFCLPMFLVLLPLAMTMALLWKTKEVILENVFGGKLTSG